MYHADRLKMADVDVVCFEKQADWGGLWNYDWRTGWFRNFFFCRQNYPASATILLGVVTRTYVES
jgi:cation diffusion facilitator CzcD-associated flavoprotein CzcO